MIQLSEVSKSFGDRVLLDHVTWQITDGDRVGLCGPNGAGKTTLLKMLAGLEEPDSGAVVRPAALSIGYLPQDGISHAGRTVFEEASLAFAPLLAIKAEMHDIEHRLGDQGMPQEQHDAILARYSDLQDQFRLGDGYSMDLRIATVLRGLGLHDLFTSNNGPGTQMVLMGMILFIPPNVAGWHLGKSWISSSSMIARYNYADYLTEYYTALNPDWPTKIQKLLVANGGPIVNENDYDGLITYFADRLIQDALTAEERSILTDFLAGMPTLNPSTRFLDRVLGLIHVMLSLPQAHRK